jgi:peptidoglycan/xylan/chitin deacetylase (PgdA/CDA1 family)
LDRVALTFDDGPAQWTTSILDALFEHRAHATFFVIGTAVAAQADLIRRMEADGHEIGNHTWSHPWLARDCNDARVRDELERTNVALAEIVGRAPLHFRAPHYDVDERVLEIAAELGLAHAHGDVTPPDWHERCTAAFITTFVVQQARGNAVIGLHDGVASKTAVGRSRQPTVDAIVALLPRLRERGLECVTFETLQNARET